MLLLRTLDTACPFVILVIVCRRARRLLPADRFEVNRHEIAEHRITVVEVLCLRAPI